MAGDRIGYGELDRSHQCHRGLEHSDDVHAPHHRHQESRTHSPADRAGAHSLVGELPGRDCAVILLRQFEDPLVGRFRHAKDYKRKQQ